MQEFSSISVSSYEAGSLADRLTEQSRDGWDVVAIIPTGSTVTAYLSRAASAEVAAVTDDEPRLTHDLEPAADDQPDDATPEFATVAATAAATADEPEEPAAEPDEPAHESSEPAADPVSEPGGWAAGADSSDAEPVSAVEHDYEHEPEPEPASSTDAGAADAASGGVATGAAPAGWYADPSSRYELRYWDGGQWTEHVSRGGQQYTDPPVA